MSIHYKNGSGLEEFASKVEFDDHTGVLTINGEDHQTFNAKVVDQLPGSPDQNTFYFVTYDGGIDPPEGGYLTKDEADQYYQPLGDYLPASLSTNNSTDIDTGKVLLPSAKAIKEYVDDTIQNAITYVVVDGMYPVGSIYMSVNNELPPVLTASGMTWEAIDGGQGLWIVNANNTNLGRHVDGVLPKHTHTYSNIGGEGGYGPGIWPGIKSVSGSSITSSTGAIASGVSGVSMGNSLRQPSFCIRAWRRTS